MTAPDIIEIAKKAGGRVFVSFMTKEVENFSFSPHNFYRFAALYREALIASGEVVEREKVNQMSPPSPFVQKYKFGQCLICGLNHGWLPCPDNEITSARSQP